MTSFFKRACERLPIIFQKAARKSDPTEPFGAAIETRLIRRKSSFISNHKHSAMRENIFSLRSRDQLKPFIAIEPLDA